MKLRNGGMRKQKNKQINKAPEPCDLENKLGYNYWHIELTRSRQNRSLVSFRENHIAKEAGSPVIKTFAYSNAHEDP